MNGRDLFKAAVNFQETDRIPHFEEMFELYKETFGRGDMASEDVIAAASGDELERLLHDCVDVYAMIVERFKWDAICIWRPWGGEKQLKCLEMTKKEIGDKVMVGGVIGYSIHSIDTTEDYMQFSIDLHEHPERIHEQALEWSNSALERGLKMADAGADIINLVSDVAFNEGPFISPAMFREFCTPYMQNHIPKLREAGLYVIQHSDGNLMPIMDDILSAKPHILHSLDPMAGMDIAEVKRVTYGKMAIMGNVQCNLLQDGPESVIRESAKYALKHGAPGGGYIYSSSNTIFDGVPLRHYEVMLEEKAIYEASKNAK